MHMIEPRGRRESHVRQAMVPDFIARLDDGVAEIVQKLALMLIGLHRGLNLIDWPAGNFAGFFVAALGYALPEPRHALRRARSFHIIVVAVGEEDDVVDVA